MKLTNILLVAILCGLTACASMSKEECLTADWKTIGYEDGSLGRPDSTIQSHRKSCAKINVTPDLAQYQQGHREGARAYCKKSTGYQLGVSGGAYYNICPPDLEASFLQAYRLGQELYVLTQSIAKVQSDISSYRSSVNELEKQKLTEKDAIVEGGSAKERRQHLKEIDHLDAEMRRYQDDIGHAEHELNHLKQDYANLQAEHRRMGY